MVIISRTLELYLILLHNSWIARFDKQERREETLTDQMDELWFNLTPEQQKLVKEHKRIYIDPHTLPSGNMRSRPALFTRNIYPQTGV